MKRQLVSVWKSEGLILIFIGAFALLVFIVYFCHVARRRWKVFNVIRIRTGPAGRRGGVGGREDGGWAAQATPTPERRPSAKSTDSEVIDGCVCL